jgi:uncharacterized C2H2 Zn-finger protein
MSECSYCEAPTITIEKRDDGETIEECPECRRLFSREPNWRPATSEDSPAYIMRVLHGHAVVSGEAHISKRMREEIEGRKP